MKTLSLLLVVLVSLNAQARPFVYTKSEFKGNEDGKTNDVNQIRVGLDTRLDNITPWVHAGLGVKSPRGEDLFQGDDFRVFAVGAKFVPMKPLVIKAKLESYIYNSSENDWKFEVKSKYYLQ